MTLMHVQRSPNAHGDLVRAQQMLLTSSEGQRWNHLKSTLGSLDFLIVPPSMHLKHP